MDCLLLFRGQLKRIAVSGGAPVAIANLASGLYGLSWGVDDTILVGQSDGIYRVAATGGTLELVIPTAEVGEFPAALTRVDAELVSPFPGFAVDADAGRFGWVR